MRNAKHNKMPATMEALEVRQLMSADMATRLEMAAAPAVPTNGTAIHASIQSPGENDWFKFTLAKKTTVTIQTSGDQGDTQMSLLNVKAKLVKFNDDGPMGQFSQISTSLSKGTYYVKVGSADALPVDQYDLRVTGEISGANLMALNLGRHWEYRGTHGGVSAIQVNDVSQMTTIKKTPALVVTQNLTAGSLAVNCTNTFSLTPGVGLCSQVWGNWQTQRDLQTFTFTTPVGVLPANVIVGKTYSSVGKGMVSIIRSDGSVTQSYVQEQDTYTVVRWETVETPAGVFDALRIDGTISSDSPNLVGYTKGFSRAWTRYYVPGVGLVKTTDTWSAPGCTPVTTDIQLTSVRG